jgi:hypothetical protein
MRYFAILGVLATACHGPLDVQNEAASDPSAPAWVHDPHLAERTTVAADTAARVWGGSSSDLDGWTIVYVAHLIDATSIGKTTGTPILGGGTIELVVFVAPCLEATSLAHEIGHVIIGDGDHKDGRWRSRAFDAQMASALLDGVPANDGDCRLRMMHMPSVLWPDRFSP